jgi:chloramphenicol O-acetyltransferase type A
MAHYLDLQAWPRREAFAFFRRFDVPWFNVCVRLDAARLHAALAARGERGLSLACCYIALRLANRHRPFRLRIEGERVRIHDEVHGSTTVLRADGESFGFADLAHELDFDVFVARARAAVEAARAPDARFDPGPADDAARVYFTTLPWLHFTSFSHAHVLRRDDSVPRLAFGRAQAEGPHLWLPISVEVHHALMDGAHVGRFVQDFEAMLAAPQDWLPSKA